MSGPKHAPTALLGLVMLAFALTAGSARAETFSYSPKLTFRTVNGILTNKGTAGGSAFSMGGVNVAFSYYVSSSVCLGLGLTANFDLSRKVLPLSGIDVFLHWYLLGQGTLVRTERKLITSETQGRLAMYFGPEISHRSFFIGNSVGINPSQDPPTGSSASLNFALGFDYHLSRHVQLTLEGNMGFMSFAASDERYSIVGMLGKIGVNYVW